MNENWSMGIVIGDGDVAGYNKFELVYSATQTDYKLTQGEGEITGQQPIVLEHISDTEAPVPARMVESNKLGRFELSVLGTTWDSIMSKAHTLNRHISGADSTAARHAIDGTAEKVRFYVLPDGASNTTYFTILSGYVDVSAAYYKAESQRGTGVSAVTGAWFIPVNFTFEPGGEGDPFTLKNSLPSSPHFIEFNTSATLADGWNLINTPTPTAETATYLIGGKSQKLVTDNSTTEGIESDAVTASTSTNAVAFFWVATNGSAADDLTIELEDGSNNSIDTAVISFNADGTESSSVSDKHRIGPDGTNWYRVVVSGANTTAADFVLRVYRASGDATQISTYYVDGAYLQTGTLIAPDGWASTSSLLNRYDPGTDEANINYLDVWGVPGDLPARTKTTVDFTTGNANSGIIYGMRHDDALSVGDYRHYLDSTEFSLFGTDWATQASASSIGGSYQYVDPTDLNPITLLDGLDTEIFRHPLRVYCLMWADSADSNILIYTQLNQAGGARGAPLALSTWSFVDCGLLNDGGIYAPNDVDAATLDLRMKAEGTASSEVRVEGIYLIPITQFSDRQSGSTTVESYIMNGPDGDIYYLSTGFAARNLQGSLISWLLPGITNRVVFAHRGDSSIEDYDIDDAIDVGIVVTPRSSHLLGAD